MPNYFGDGGTDIQVVFLLPFPLPILFLSVMWCGVVWCGVT